MTLTNGTTMTTCRFTLGRLFFTFAVYLVLLSLDDTGSARGRSSFHHVRGDEVGSDSFSVDSTGSVEEQEGVNCDLVCSEKVAEAVMAFANEKMGLQREHESIVHSLKQEHDAALLAVEKQHQSEKEELVQQAAALQAALEQLKQHQAEKEELSQQAVSLQAALEQLKQQHEQEVSVLTKKHDGSIHDCSTQLQQSQERTEHLVQEISVAQQQLRDAQSITVTDIVRKELQALYRGLVAGA
jgi:glutamate-1-semialdehyde aminotransferase